MRKKTRDKIKFDNRTIEAIKVNDLEFTYVAKDGSVKAKRKILLPFQVPKKSITKGLKLCIHRDTGSKYFWLQFWYNGKADYYSVGKFIPGSWGVSDVEDKLYPIVRSHTNDKGHWVKNPNETERKEKAEKERLKSEGDIAYFYQEYQNIPMDDAFRVFKKAHIQYWDGRYIHEGGKNCIMRTDEGRKTQVPVNIFIGVDPASSENVKADYTVVMCVAVDPEYNIYVVDYFRGQVSPMDGATQIMNFADNYHPRDIRVEKTGHVMLSDYLIRESKRTGRFLNISAKDAIKTKYFRIKEMQPLFASKAMFLKEEHDELESELLSFKEHGQFKKDTLDALRWATEDVFAPHLKLKNGEWTERSGGFSGVDWETGEFIYA